MEYFVIDSRNVKQGAVNYTLKDTVNEEVLGSFYQPELSRVKVTDDMVYRVDKVLRKRKKSSPRFLGWMATKILELDSRQLAQRL